jgi:hypothetical protein
VSNPKCFAFSVTPTVRVVHQNSEVDSHHRCSVDHFGLRDAGFPGFNVIKEKKVLDLGPIQAETRENERIPVPPALAWVLVAGGIVVVVVVGARGLCRSLILSCPHKRQPAIRMLVSLEEMSLGHALSESRS